jgi:hypothetical protein
VESDEDAIEVQVEVATATMLVKGDDDGTVRLPLAIATTRSSRLGSVGSHVARQSLDCVLRRLPSIYVALREGGSTVIHDKRPRSGRELNWVSQFRRSFQKEEDHIPNVLPLDLHISS